MSQQAIKNKVDIEAEFIDKTLEDSQSGHQMSRAGRLAMELAAEKRRLMTELEEVQAENDDLKSTTPIGTSDWYVKWVATGLSVFGIFVAVESCGHNAVESRNQNPEFLPIEKLLPRNLREDARTYKLKRLINVNYMF